MQPGLFGRREGPALCVTVHEDCADFRGASTVPIFAAESAKMGLSPSARKGTGTFFGPKRAEK